MALWYYLQHGLFCLGLACNGMPCLALPCFALLWLGVAFCLSSLSWTGIPCLGLPCLAWHVMACLALAWHVMACLALAWHVMACIALHCRASRCFGLVWPFAWGACRGPAYLALACLAWLCLGINCLIVSWNWERNTPCHSKLVSTVSMLLYFPQFQDTTYAFPCHIHLPVCLWIMDPHSRTPKEEYELWKWRATARYYASHTKTMLPTRKSVPRSSRQSDHKKTSWPLWRDANCSGMVMSSVH